MSAVVAERGELVIDPAGLCAAQLSGEACAVCRKAWPAPRVRVGRFPDGRPARCCPECAPVVAG